MRPATNHHHYQDWRVRCTTESSRVLCSMSSSEGASACSTRLYAAAPTSCNLIWHRCAYTSLCIRVANAELSYCAHFARDPTGQDLASLLLAKT
ncbi:hypothetical protein KCU81_g699, partial [Aureobasidium melanogenum]